MPQQNVQQLVFLQRRRSSGKYRVQKGSTLAQFHRLKQLRKGKPHLNCPLTVQSIYIRAHHTGKYTQSAGKDDVRSTDVPRIDCGATEGSGQRINIQGHPCLGILKAQQIPSAEDACLFGHRRFTLVETTIIGQLGQALFLYIDNNMSLLLANLKLFRDYYGGLLLKHTISFCFVF